MAGWRGELEKLEQDFQEPDWWYSPQTRRGEAERTRKKVSPTTKRKSARLRADLDDVDAQEMSPRLQAECKKDDGKQVPRGAARLASGRDKIFPVSRAVT